MRTKRILMGGLLFLSGLFSFSAQAVCTLAGAPLNGTVNFGTVTFQRDAPVGTLIASTSFLDLNGPTVTCGPTWTYAGVVNTFPTISSYGNDVYDTNIPGVGIQIYFGSNIASNIPFSSRQNASPYKVGGTVIVRLIKTSGSAPGGGVLTNGRLTTFTTDGANVYNINLTGTNTIVMAACSVTNTAINVPIGDVPRRDFTGIGSTAADRLFNIPLDCNAGTSVNVTLDAAEDLSGAPGVIALNGASSAGVASGVGVQLLQNTAPVTFGVAKAIGTTTTDGLYNIPMVARYYQTGPVITAGQANATATFTMTYN